MKIKRRSLDESYDNGMDKKRFFIGYHGTNLSSANDILEEGLKPNLAGSGQGLARGKGFYVARNYSMSVEYAQTSTQNYIDEDDNGNPLRVSIVANKVGDEGSPAVLKVYSHKNLNSTVDIHEGNRFIKQGVISSFNDPHGDARIGSYEIQLEMVIRLQDYDALSFELVTNNVDTSLNGQFVTHEDPLH